MKGHSAWYRKQGTGCFDFVNRKEFASDLTGQECNKIVEHASWYCSQYDADSIEIVDSDGRREADIEFERCEKPKGSKTGNTIEEVKADICDHYCKYPGMEYSGETGEALEEICKTCPMERL